MLGTASRCVERGIDVVPVCSRKIGATVLGPKALKLLIARYRSVGPGNRSRCHDLLNAHTCLTHAGTGTSGTVRATVHSVVWYRITSYSVVQCRIVSLSWLVRRTHFRHARCDRNQYYDESDCAEGSSLEVFVKSGVMKIEVYTHFAFRSLKRLTFIRKTLNRVCVPF